MSGCREFAESCPASIIHRGLGTGHSVASVSWHEAAHDAAWLSKSRPYRFLTKAEWEYAAGTYYQYMQRWATC
ncbi:hypothetical protein CO678_15920 [Bradyrhizobium diazoefficiens]|uniref:SUMF1/EgtB/PvdO family nonheme iron enzyme n=1 Tax=Bradyrhizobium diazoefficiens TaxID=1355477 RepID=UPI000BE81696|nr:SUMF1/EgtB/PvdO family nonheme iron enzyme [Bradyrhizobium diazoefficiens]PDT60518.1 hypothetical protein CO678_15920 [Bradyrhizobium diazoefficiens]